MQVVIVFGGLSAAVEVIKMTSMLSELGRIVLRADDMQDVEITLIDGSEVQIRGYITFDVPPEIETYLKYNPNISYIHLNSPGGRIGAARRLRDLIESHGLSTYTESGCFSACTIAVLGGTERIVHSSAFLGFHQMEMPGLSRAEISTEEEVDKKYFLAKGIPSSFVQRAFGAPYEDMWYPSHDELAAAHFITHVYDGQEIWPVM